MSTEIDCAATKIVVGDSLGAALDDLERLKTKSQIMEAQLMNCVPGLAELASNMSDDIDVVVQRLTAPRN